VFRALFCGFDVFLARSDGCFAGNAAAGEAGPRRADVRENGGRACFRSAVRAATP